MFGIYRYALAFCVAISHMWGNMIGGPAAYAVWGFYCLSGYLMTLVLNEKYGFSRNGVRDFFINRSLRIYPGYYAVCVVMLLIFIFIPETASRFLPQLHMPTTISSWLFSLTLLTPLTGGGELLHGCSALHVELCMYIAMALGLSRSIRTTGAWFFVSVLYTAYLLKSGVAFAERYAFVLPCTMAFSTGAFLYHLSKHIPPIKSPWAAVSAAAIWWLHVWVTQHVRGGPWNVGLYTSLIVSCFAILTLKDLKKKELPRWAAKLDTLCGNLSYPVYLCHWSIAVLVVYALPHLQRGRFLVFAIGFPIVNIVAYVIYRYIEKPCAEFKIATGSGHSPHTSPANDPLPRAHAKAA